MEGQQYLSASFHIFNETYLCPLSFFVIFDLFLKTTALLFIKYPNTKRKNSNTTWSFSSSSPIHNCFLPPILSFSSTVFSSYLHCHSSSVPCIVTISSKWFLPFFYHQVFSLSYCFASLLLQGILPFPYEKYSWCPLAPSATVLSSFFLSSLSSLNNFRSHISVPLKISSPCIHLQTHLMCSVFQSKSEGKYSILRYAPHFCWGSSSLFFEIALLLTSCYSCVPWSSYSLQHVWSTSLPSFRPLWGSQMCLSLLPFWFIFITYLCLILSTEHKFNYPLNTDDLQISSLAQDLSFKILPEYHCCTKVSLAVILLNPVCEFFTASNINSVPWNLIMR